jgi:hypothetical protein
MHTSRGSQFEASPEHIVPETLSQKKKITKKGRVLQTIINTPA